MTHDRPPDRSTGMLDTLLTPLRLPQRVVTEIETIAHAARALSDTVGERLRSIDERAGALVKGLGRMQASLIRLENRVDELMSLEATIEQRMDAVRADLNTRMLAIEHELRAMQPTIAQIARDVAKIDQLLPDPDAGPLARLKDTLTSS
jgi:archaellum component FlaC